MPMVLVDVLNPSTFEKTGIVKTTYDAWKAGDWIGSFNLWVVRRNDGVESVLYQQRSFDGLWAPGLLDVAVGGHYSAGETIDQGLREAREELGKDYEFSELQYLGKKLYLLDQEEWKFRYVVDVFIVRDDSPLSSFTLQRDELEGLYSCPIHELLRLYSTTNHSFTAEGVRFSDGILVPGCIDVTKDMFPSNWDKYHLKMAILARRFLRKEPDLMY